MHLLKYVHLLYVLVLVNVNVYQYLDKSSFRCKCAAFGHGDEHVGLCLGLHRVHGCTCKCEFAYIYLGLCGLTIPHASVHPEGLQRGLSG